MKYAYIRENFVNTTSEFSDMQWRDGQIVECPDYVEYGWTYINGEWKSPIGTVSPEANQFEKDQALYKKRAAVKDDLISYMAADNISRVRSGQWTDDNLLELLADPDVSSANALMGTLAFELASAKIMQSQSTLLTQSIKDDWVSKLQQHFYT